MHPLRIAVLGVGRLGRAHARWVNAISETTLSGVFDIDIARANEVAKEIGTTACESLEQALDNCDAVCIVAPTSAHHELTMTALSRGKHVLVEKPIASSLPQADEMISAARQGNLVLAVGHIERFNPAFLALASESLSPRFIEAHRLAAFDPRGADVAVILDLMVHDIDLALALVKSPVEHIDASAVAVISDKADIANARLTFASGAVANLTASRISLRPMRKLRIFQPSGYFSLDFETKSADIYTLANHGSSDTTGMRIPLGKSGRDILYETRGGSTEDMLKMELIAFVAAVRGQAPVAVSGADGRAALEVALEVERIGQENARRASGGVLVSV